MCLHFFCGILGIRLPKYTQHRFELSIGTIQWKRWIEVNNVVSLFIHFHFNFMSSCNFSALFAHQIENQYGHGAGKQNGNDDIFRQKFHFEFNLTVEFCAKWQSKANWIFISCRWSVIIILYNESNWNWFKCAVHRSMGWDCVWMQDDVVVNTHIESKLKCGFCTFSVWLWSGLYVLFATFSIRWDLWQLLLWIIVFR